MAQKLYEESNIQAIANAIRAKNGLTETYKTSEMAGAIEAIQTGGGDLPEEAFVVSGNCQYRFAYGGWDWFIENYGNRITTKDITETQYMFGFSTVSNIPFTLNFKEGQNYHSTQNMFYRALELTTLPTMVNFKPDRFSVMLASCYKLREIPDEWIESIDYSYVQSYQYSQNSKVHDSCYSLRKAPNKLYEKLVNVAPNTASYMFTNGLCADCYTLDEVTNIPVFTNKVMTSNMFDNTAINTYRLMNYTFKLNENGQPYIAEWKSQTIDLSSYAGWMLGSYKTRILGYNSGITADKEVKDDATYQALKNDPDWWTAEVAYSRYNHDSAVATINSLPDTSAYLATAGGTNTIKFEGDSGSLTDGGAINTLTEEEIAVAAAKGWTVTLK